MPNLFKRPELRQAYDSAARAYATKDAALVWVDGSSHRGSAQAQAFWDGFDGVDPHSYTRPAERDKTTYAWWRAGRDARQTRDRHPTLE